MKVELANDIIARKVYEAASIDDKARAMAKKFVEERYRHFCRSKSILLSRQELAFVQPYLNQLSLSDHQTDFIARSRERIERRKKRKRYRDASIVALFCIVVFSSWGIWERKRYAKAHQDWTYAQDSINRLLRTARNATTVSSNERNNRTPAPTASIIQFHTLVVRGRITNAKGRPIRQATVQVLGATVKSDNKGRYQLHLVLPPQYWSHAPELRIKKEFYQDAFHTLDLDKNKIEWNPVLEERN
jgi:hypothetical protein